MYSELPTSGLPPKRAILRWAIVRFTQLACLNDSYVSGGDVCILCPFFYPFLHGGPKKCFFCPKIIVFAPKSSFPAISGSSRLKWVEHRSNWVEHYISHPGWSVETFKPAWKCPWGALECSKNDYCLLKMASKVASIQGRLGPPRAIFMGAKRS